MRHKIYIYKTDKKSMYKLKRKKLDKKLVQSKKKVDKR